MVIPVYVACFGAVERSPGPLLVDLGRLDVRQPARHLRHHAQQPFAARPERTSAQVGGLRFLHRAGPRGRQLAMSRRDDVDDILQRPADVALPHP